MSLRHSDETHRNLVARIPEATGRQLREWFKAIDDGPAFLRFEDRVNWLREEHGLSYGHAKAIVHEHERRRTLHAFE